MSPITIGVCEVEIDFDLQLTYFQNFLGGRLALLCHLTLLLPFNKVRLLTDF